MKIEHFKIEALIPYEFNNRNHSEEQVDRIANSIKEFGFNQPLVIDESNIVLVGHGRLFAAKKLGLEKVPVLKKSGLSDNQKKAYRILDNKLQNDSTWSFDNLELEFGFLEDNGFDLEPWGLEELRDLFTPEDPEVTDDEFDPSECENEETFIKLGDLIELGKHRVFCGDSLQTDAIISLFGDDKCELCFTSPPYSDMRDYEDGIELSEKHLSGFIGNWEPFTNYFVVNLGLKFEDHAVVPYWNEYLASAERNNLKLLAWNVWDKTQGGSIASATNMFLLTHEWLFVFGDSGKKLNRTIPNNLKAYEKSYGKNWKQGIEGKSIRQKSGEMSTTSSITYLNHQLHSVIQQTPELGTVRKSHPAIFPLGLVGEYLKAMTTEGDIVGDAFLGSGTTLIAADQLNRICYGMEISPKYCHVIIERYKKHCEKVGKPFECKINGQKADL